MVAQGRITWEDFSRIMANVYGQHVTEHETRTEIEIHTCPNSLGPDTFAFLQILDKLYELYEHPVDEYMKTQ